MTSATFTLHSTPVGDALLVFTDVGLVTLELLHAGESADAPLARLAQALHEPAGHESSGTGPAAAVCAQLDEYFARRRRVFDVSIDWRLVRGFTRTALETVCEIPYGETAAYGEVAVLAGHPHAHRAVGTACARTPFSIVVPVHRVVRADGSIGEYGGHPEVKRYLIDLEAGVGV